MAILVTLVVDGGCTVQADNGPGSWAALLMAHKPDSTTVEKALSGMVENTTNNRMELTAVIEGLRALKQIGVCVEVECTLTTFSKSYTLVMLGCDEKLYNAK